MATWPKRFTKQIAEKLGRTKDHPADQVAIANLVYGDRMGNQNNGISDNDGYEYRGSGFCQLTGKDNYLSFLNYLHRQGKNLSLTIETIDDYVRTEEGAISSSLWFWLSKSIGVLARKDDVLGVTKVINGGTHGLDERRKLTEKYKGVLGL